MSAPVRVSDGTERHAEGLVHELVFGSREGVPAGAVRGYVQSRQKNRVIVTGGAPGVDMDATQAAYESWARGELAGLEVFPAMWRDWEFLGNRNAAGPERNARMERRVSAGLGFRAEGKSNGTDGMADLLLRGGKWVRVLRAPWQWGAR